MGMSKKMIGWEHKFMPILKKIHKNHAKKIFHRLMKKSSTLKTSLKRRSKEYEVVFDLSLDSIRYMLLDNYGKQCKYCDKQLVIQNMVCDHLDPISNGGPSVRSNLQMICARCNTRKGPLTHQEYIIISEFLDKQSDDIKMYVYRKLSMADVS